MALDMGEDAQRKLLLAIVTICSILSISSFGLRIAARLRGGLKLWWDDYWMVLALVLSLALACTTYVGVANGLGLHQTAADLSAGSLDFLRKTAFVAMLLWTLSAFAVKLGLLLSYHRAFDASPRFRVVVAVAGVFALAVFLANLFPVKMRCLPSAGESGMDLTAECFDVNDVYRTVWILHVVSNLVVLALPALVLWKVAMPLGRRVALAVLFFVAAFVCTTGVLRLLAFRDLDHDDFTYTIVGATLWSNIEVLLGFTCANLPFAAPVHQASQETTAADLIAYAEEAGLEKRQHIIFTVRAQGEKEIIHELRVPVKDDGMAPKGRAISEKDAGRDRAA